MDLIKEAESLLLYQFANSPKIKALVSSLIKPFSEVLDQSEELHYGQYITKASGATLDVIGEVVDFPRAGFSDDQYRVWLAVAVLLNNGHGTYGDVVAILRVLFGHQPRVQIDELKPNILEFFFFDHPTVPLKTLFSIIRRAVPVCTNCRFINASGSRPAFQFDTTGFDNSVLADFFEEG